MLYHTLLCQKLLLDYFFKTIAVTMSAITTFEAVSSTSDWMLCVYVYIRQVEDGPARPKEPEVLR